jgi:site-specific DNA recombinase
MPDGTGGGDVFEAWAERTGRRRAVGHGRGGFRFVFYAVVIGKYERAFYGAQYASMAPLLEHYGIQLWTPEVGGRVDWHAKDHERTMLALGLSSRREIARTRIRVRTAMATVG